MTRNKCVKNFKDRLLKTMEGSSVAAFAKKCNMSETVIRDYLSGKTYPSLARLQIIAEKNNVSYNWLATGYKLEDLANKKEQGKNSNKEPIHYIPVYEKQLPTREESLTKQYVRETPPVLSYPIIKGWAHYRGLDINKLIIYWAKGDLMSPEIQNNNGIIINTEKSDIIDGAIYLIELENMTILRRIRLKPDGWLLVCNNNNYPAFEVHKKEFVNYKIIGRVVQIIQDVF